MDGLSIALITFDEKNDRNCYSIGLSASNFPDGFTEIVEKDLISYWSFDSGKMQGKKVVDGFGKHNGNIQGVLKSVKGKIGEVLAFDADKADFAQFDDTKELDLAETLLGCVGSRLESKPPVSCLPKREFLAVMTKGRRPGGL